LPSDVEIWNLYGGTEMPYVLAQRLLPETFERANTFTQLGLNVSLSVFPFPDGVAAEALPGRDVGELVVHGPGIFSGYLDPASERLISSSRSHHTGDLVRAESSGRITILGRLDRQVKIDGVRVELDAIEWALESHPDVVEAAAVPTLDRLEVVAFVVSARKSPASLRRELEELCEGRLLPVECPSEYRLIERLPRTPSGKKDRKALHCR
jgi:acyl-coenzyme A synthetase/AMP-(fatty) acid ligase